MINAKEIIQLFEKQFNKGFPIGEDDIIEFQSSPLLNTKRILSIYSIRYDSYKKEHGRTSEWEDLLSELSLYNDEYTNIYSLQHRNGFLLIFTNKQSNRILGFINSAYISNVS